MKNFLKTTLAVLLALVILELVSGAIFFGIIGSMSMEGRSSAPIPAEGVLKIDMSALTVTEQATQEIDAMSAVQSGEMTASLGLWESVCAINAAAEDPSVKYIYLKTDGNTSSLATLSELRKSLQNFRRSGKAVVAYIEAPTTGSYYLASVADRVYMTTHPGSTVMFTGLSGRMMFLKDLLDKVGVRVQLIRHGKYKSAGEMFVRDSPSEANLEQNREMISSMWKSLAAEICESRGISPHSLDDLIDGLGLCLPEDFLKAGLVDSLVTREELKDVLAMTCVKEKFADVDFIDFPDYVEQRIRVALSRSRKKIAVIYADGEIVDGDAVEEVAGDRFAALVSKVRADSAVKAVVLRVNSPGGSVIASDKIRRELELLRQAKPLIGSYGDYAASGGYWISAGCDKIYSDPVTLTGSIGVFSMIPDLSRTYRDIAHVGITSVGSHRHSDMYSLSRPLDNAELEYMQKSVEDIYDRFTSLVASSRGMDRSRVDEIAQGRVWTGSDALSINLVDEMGTLEDAVRYAALCGGDADLAAWKVEGYPAPQTVMEMIMEMVGQKLDKGDNVLAGTAFAAPAKVFTDWKKGLDGRRDGMKDIYFARLPFGLTVE